MTRRAGVVGLGLIGGSIGMALRERGWVVVGSDTDAQACADALAAGAVDEIGDAANAEVTFVATPVGHLASTVRELLTSGASVVTDVGLDPEDEGSSSGEDASSTSS